MTEVVTRAVGPRAVAVGFDGSAASKRAVDWAVAEARGRSAPLRLVTVHLTLGAPPEPEPGQPDASADRQAVREMLERYARATAAKVPDVTVEWELISALSSGAGLVSRSAEWLLLVVGDHGGGFAGILLGSTASQVCAHARCPVIVTRGPASRTGPYSGRVVVGVDGSAPSRAALRFGLHEARLRGVGAVVVHAWRFPPAARDSFLATRNDGTDMETLETVVLAESLAGVRERYPEVPVKRLSAYGTAREVLLEQSAGALLLVVGSRGVGGFTGLLLGSTSQALAQHADVPVAIVHANDKQDKRTHRSENPGQVGVIK